MNRARTVAAVVLGASTVVAWSATAAGQSPHRPETALRAEVRGDSLYANFETDAAIETYEEGLELHPHDTNLLWRASRALVARSMEDESDEGDEERLERAVRLARRAVQTGPAHPRAHTALAASLGLYGNLVAHKYRLARAREVVRMGEEVHEHARRAIELDPDHFAPYVILGVFHRELAVIHPMAKMVAKTFLGGYPDVSVEESEAYLRRAVRLNADDLTARLEYAKTLLELDREEEARAQLREALDRPLFGQVERHEREKVKELLAKIS